MTITVAEIQKLADLSRLKLKDGEAERYAKEIGNILKYVDQIQEVTEGQDMSSSNKKPIDFPHRNVLRDDVPDKLINPSPEKLIEAAPEHEDGLVKVKKILA